MAIPQLPPGPGLRLDPGGAEEVDPNDVVIQWMPVQDPPGSEIIGYEVIIEAENVLGGASVADSPGQADVLPSSLLRNAQIDTDGSVLVGIELAEPIPFDATDVRLTYAAVFDRDNNEANNFQALPQFDLDFFQNTDLWYEVQLIPGPGWRVQRRVWTGASALSTPTDAIAIVSGRVLLLIIPRSEFPDGPREVPFRVSAFAAAPTDPFGLLTGLAIGDTAPSVRDPRAVLPLP